MLFGPDIFAGFGVVVVQPPDVVHPVHVLLHIVGKMGEHDARVTEIGGIPFQPFQRHIALIVNGAQRPHNGVHGQVALSHDLIHGFAVFHHRVLGVGVFDVCAQILYRGLRGFPGIPIGMVNIPQGADVVAFNPVQQLPESCGVGIHAVGLHQQGHALFLRIGNQRL